MAKKNGGPPAPAPAQAPQQRQPPAAVFRVGRIKATVWGNQHAEQGTWYSVSLARSYKDKDGHWKTATSFGKDDLLVVGELCRQAFHWINVTQQQAAHGERQPGEDPDDQGGGPAE